MAKLSDYKRNFIVLVIASLLNFSFAMEKLFIINGFPLSGSVWFFVYFMFSFVLAIIAFYDYYHDIKENKITTPNII